MRTLFTILILFFSVSSYSQTVFAPEGANWNYYYDGHNGGYSEDWCIKVINDTIENGYPTKYLERTSIVTMSFPPQTPVGTVNETYFGILQDRNDSIFYNNRFLYSFTMNIDDTITIDPMFPNLIAVVDTVYDTIVGGNILSTWRLTKYCYDFGSYYEFGKTQIIEDIGPINDYLLWNTDGCPIGGGWWTFQCYASSSLNYNLPCTPMAAGIDKLEELIITVYPNPTSDILYVQSKDAIYQLQWNIMDINGRSVLTGALDVDSSGGINIDKLEMGSYLLQLSNANSSIILHFIKGDR